MARGICAPLVDLVVIEPKEAAEIRERLIAEADGEADACFWVSWRDFADRVAAAPWLARLEHDRPYEAILIDRVFLMTFWEDNVKRWPRLDCEGHDHCDACSSRYRLNVMRADDIRFRSRVARDRLADWVAQENGKGRTVHVQR